MIPRRRGRIRNVIWPATFAAGALALLSCAGPTSREPPAKTVALPPAQPREPAAPETPALPSSLRALPPDADNYFFFDGERFRGSPLAAALDALAESAQDDPFLEAKQKCHFDPAREIDEAALAARFRGSESAVAAIRFRGGPDRAYECLKTLGAHELESGGLEPRPGMLVERAGRFLVAGDPAGVRLAVGRLGPGGRTEVKPKFAKALARYPDAILVGTLSTGSLVPESGFGDALVEITAAPSRFELRAEADTAEPEVARSYAKAFEASGAIAGAQAFLPKIRLWVEGSKMMFELSVDGAANEQATRVGAAAALAVNGVRRYLLRSKEAEAKSALVEIASDLGAYVRALPAAKRRFPASAPPTPKDVPRGVSTAMSPADWQHPTWRAIHYEMNGPVRYSYEIVTAKNGRSAEVRATGDLDGDGVFSHFSLTLTLDKKGDVDTSAPILFDNELE
jgi:hypothetical protein